MKKQDSGLLTIGQRIAWVRGKRGLSQSDLAKAVGVSQGSIGNVESGLRDRPREMLKIAEVLRASPRWLERMEGDWDVDVKPSLHLAAPPSGEIDAETILQALGDFLAVAPVDTLETAVSMLATFIADPKANQDLVPLIAKRLSGDVQGRHKPDQAAHWLSGEKRG